MAIFRRKPKGENPPTGRPELPIPTTYAELLTFSINYVAAQQQAHTSLWGLGTEQNWDVDLDAGTLTWHATEKGMTVTAPTQLLGTWNPDDQTFLWGWDHPSAPPGTAIAAEAVRQYATAHGIAELQPRSISCSFDECYRVAATASPIGDLQGVYRADAGGPWVYLGFGPVSIQQA